MTDKDTITLPREVVEQLLKMLEMVEPYADQLTDYSSTAAEWPLNLLPEKVGIAITALRTHLAAEPQKPEPVAKAWAEGYQQGVKDERTSEASIGIAGFGAKVEPARQNPYGTALAAEQPKPEPVASDDDEEFTREDVTTLLLEVMDWTYAKAHRDRPMTEAEQKVLNDIRTALAAEPVKPITVPKTVPLPPITCGFVDVRFDGDGWFCTKCGKRMSADFETSVKRGSSEKCYLELMQRKAEAVRTMSERNMK